MDKSSAQIGCLFDQTWLSWYPQPSKVVFDNGSEFKKDFVPLLKDWSIQPKYTTIKNPTANSPVERIHQVICHMFLTKNFKGTIFDYIDPFGSILASVAWAIRASYNSATQTTLARLVFGQDMMFNISSLVNWRDLSIRKQKLVDKANLQESNKRVDFDYEIGQQVYVVAEVFFANWKVLGKSQNLVPTLLLKYILMVLSKFKEGMSMRKVLQHPTCYKCVVWHRSL